MRYIETKLEKFGINLLNGFSDEDKLKLVTCGFDEERRIDFLDFVLTFGLEHDNL